MASRDLRRGKCRLASGRPFCSFSGTPAEVPHEMVIESLDDLKAHAAEPIMTKLARGKIGGLV